MSLTLMLSIDCPAPFAKIEEFVGLNLKHSNLRDNPKRRSARIGQVEVLYDLPPYTFLNPPYDHDWKVTLYFIAPFNWHNLQLALILTFCEHMTGDLGGKFLGWTDGGTALFYDNGKELFVNTSSVDALRNCSLILDRYTVVSLAKVAHKR